MNNFNFNNFRESGMRDRGLGGGAATSPSERRGETRQSGGARCTLKYCYLVN